MANFLYDKGLEGILDGSIDVLTDDIKVALVSAAYTPTQATDEFVSDLSGIQARSGNLGSKTATAGVFDAADVTVSAVAGVAVTQLVIYQDSGVDGTSRLLARVDTGTGLPFTPSGSDVPIIWDGGANKIFRI